MTPTREQCLKWAEEAGFNVENGAVNDGIETAADFSVEVEALCQRVWNEAIEASANECQKLSDQWPIDDNLFDLAGSEIRNLKVTP